MLPGERQEEVLSTSRGAGTVGGIVINDGTTRRTPICVHPSAHRGLEKSCPATVTQPVRGRGRIPRGALLEFASQTLAMVLSKC